jgi:hypothetical protein
MLSVVIQSVSIQCVFTLSVGILMVITLKIVILSVYVECYCSKSHYVECGQNDYVKFLYIAHALNAITWHFVILNINMYKLFFSILTHL